MKRIYKLMDYPTVFVVLIFVHLSSGSTANDCTQWTTCDQCIQYASTNCAWCSQEDYLLREAEPYRCDLAKNHIEQRCTEIINPTSKIMPTKNDELTNITKVKPQQVVVELRPGEMKSFDISVRTPENYPVDVYMLMDMSYSMKDNLQAVEGLGEKLANEMSSITTRFRIGFGTMVDKPLTPFMEPNKDHFNDQPADGRYIVAPWVYQNALPLTVNASLFTDSVKIQNLSESVDGPDGWPDTLMQVAVCDKAVGWKPKDEARRLVVISTEEQFHIAGDGLLGGIVTPNDGRCKLGNDNIYLGKNMDYPSLPHLRHVLSENGIVPIFAVAPGSLKLYENVADYFGVEIGARAGGLAANSTNIVSLIRDTYEQIGKTQTVFHSADGIENIKVEYEAQCLSGQRDASGRKCENVPIGKKVTFEVSVTLERCPTENDKGYAEFNITTALGDIVPVRVKFLCDCNCTDHTVKNSSECSGEGDFQCGNCYCKDGVTGEKCECPSSQRLKNKQKCIAPNDTKVCSGRGACECGKCVCIKSKTSRVDGKFCECSDTNCDVNEFGLCGGEERGECVCNECKCKPGWSGPSCGCSNDTSACFENGVECSGRGKCECNKCVCKGQYTGALCDTCDGCRKGCSYYQDCVRCEIFKTGPRFDDGTCSSRCNVTIKVVDNLDSYKTEGTVKCVPLDDEDDCTFEFVLHETDDKVEIFASEEKKCPREEGYLIIIIGVILGIVAIGAALLLIWKLLATIQDRREFAKFEREQQNARWDTSENPIFKQATTTFQNPTYGGKG